MGTTQRCEVARVLPRRVWNAMSSGTGTGCFRHRVFPGCQGPRDHLFHGVPGLVRSGLRDLTGTREMFAPAGTTLARRSEGAVRAGEAGGSSTRGGASG